MDLKRIKKDVDGTVTKFVYETAPQFNELYPLTYVGENQFEFGVNILAEYDGSNNLKASYVNGLNIDENIAKTIGENTYYFLQDGLGSVRNLVDASEVAQNTYDFYAFGNDIGTPTENIANQFKFTGREWDNENSLYFYRTRHYAPQLGRFIQRDAYLVDVIIAKNEVHANAEYIRNLLPLFAYVSSNPVNQTDPFGFDCKEDYEKCLDKVDEWDKDCRDRGILGCAAVCKYGGGVACLVCVAGCITACRGQEWCTDKYCKCKYDHCRCPDKYKDCGFWDRMKCGGYWWDPWPGG